MEPSKFDPNQLTFEEGLKRITQASEKIGIKLDRGILTSRDKDVFRLTNVLRVTNVPAGFVKWQLPVYLDKPSQLFISSAAPLSTVETHSHRDGDGIRFIVSGSIDYNGQELSAGDWMFIPAGQEYSFQVGPRGATMCYCYCCCCAGAQLADDVINPTPLIPA